MSEISRDDIINSVEYKWRMFYRNYMLVIYGIISIVFLFMFLFIGLTKQSDVSSNNEMIRIMFFVWLICEIVLGFVFIPSALYYHFKAKKFLRDYKNLKEYEVILDTPASAYMYRGAVYYTVTINHEIESKKVDTNPYFSSRIFSKFHMTDYHNEKVIGLYDEERTKFYIIKKLQ